MKNVFQELLIYQPQTNDFHTLESYVWNFLLVSLMSDGLVNQAEQWN